MSRKRDEFEARRFYVRWAPLVATFCDLYIGDPQVVDAVVEEVFLEYFRGSLPLAVDHVPAQLMSLALQESTEVGEVEGSDPHDTFEGAVLALSPEERAVFILHGILELQLPWVAAITQVPFATVSLLWVRALIRLRMSLVRDQCSQLLCDLDLAAHVTPGAFA